MAPTPEEDGSKEDSFKDAKIAAWRQLALARITVLEARKESIAIVRKTPEDAKLLDGVAKSLKTAKEAATKGFNLTGAAVECAWNNIHAAEAVLLRLVDDRELRAFGVDVLALARQHLPETDPDRAALETLLVESQPAASKPVYLEPDDREIAVHALMAAQAASTIEKMQARSFRNTVYIGTALLLIVAGGLAALGLTMSNALQLCFPSQPVSPSTSTICPAGGTNAGGYDILVVEIVGLAAASLTAALSISKLQGTATPYMIPLALILLKLPAGAVSAVLGLILIGAGLIPGLDMLTSQVQILAWAALFGAGQQAITRFVDAKGQKVLESVRGPGLSSGESPQLP